MKNKYEICGEKTIIFLKKRDGSFLKALIDTEDLEKVSNVKGTWTPRATYYDTHYVEINTKALKKELHRFIMDAPIGYVVDHINHDPLDNRKSNLRIVTHRQNLQNRNGAQTNSTTGIRGVSWHKQSKKWQAVVGLNNKSYTLGLFNDIIEAEKVVKNYRAHIMQYSKEDENIQVDESLLPIKGGAYKTNKSGVRGVYLDKETKKWRAVLTRNNKRTNIGRFDTVDEAEQAINNAKKH